MKKVKEPQPVHDKRAHKILKWTLIVIIITAFFAAVPVYYLSTESKNIDAEKIKNDSLKKSSLHDSLNKPVENRVQIEQSNTHGDNIGRDKVIINPKK